MSFFLNWSLSFLRRVNSIYFYSSFVFTLSKVLFSMERYLYSSMEAANLFLTSLLMLSR